MERSPKKIIHKPARDHDLQIDAQGQRSTIASTPTARKRNLRRTRNPSELAGQLTCLGAYTRHRLTLSLLLCIAGGLEQFNRRHQRPHQRSFFKSKPPLLKELPRAASSAPAKADIPRKSPPRARSPIRTQSAFGHKAPPRGLNKAEPRSKSGSNPPQGYIVKPPPPQVVKAAAASAATSETGTRFRSPPRRPPPAPPPPPGRPVPPKELTIALDWHGVLDVGQQGPHLNPEVIRHLVQFAADYAPINFIVLSFVGRAASEHRRR